MKIIEKMHQSYEKLEIGSGDVRRNLKRPDAMKIFFLKNRAFEASVIRSGITFMS